MNTEAKLLDLSEDDMREVYYALAQRYSDIKLGRYDGYSKANDTWAAGLFDIMEKIRALGVIV